MALSSPRNAPRALACVLSLIAVVFVSACGGGGSGNGGSADSGGSQEVAQKTDFPASSGKTMAELRDGLGPGPVLAPTVSILEPGKNRLGFGLFDRAHKQLSDVPAAVYVASAKGGPASGPYYAGAESLTVKPPYQSQTVKNDPDAARSIYVAEVPFPEAGQYEVMGVVKLDGRLVATDPLRAQVVKDSGGVPDVGQKAPRIVTPTVASVGGDQKKIDTRVPLGTMHDVNFADVLGKKPILLLFATPALCQSRVCGPVVDVAEEVKAEHQGETAFIHMEIYNDNELEKGFRPQVAAYHLPTEPWAFAIDRNGKIAARLEGAYSKNELVEALKTAEAK
jgi:hypothetical protein